MKHKYFTVGILFFLLQTVFNKSSFAQQDTITVMTYNVFGFGYTGCRGAASEFYPYLKTIVKYSNVDLLGMVKVAAIKVTPTDDNGLSPYGFQDSIIKYALDPAYPGRYASCALTNITASGHMDVLFYNQNKLGFLSVRMLVSNQEDFDLFKLFYKDPNLTYTHDTTFLYVILNHTASGSYPNATRDAQVEGTMQALTKLFYHLPNIIDMGDFNLHNSGEAGYQSAVNPTDTNYRFFDPPFFPDAKLVYPIDWDSDASKVAAYLTTTTRTTQSALDNTCGGTIGGGKNWYDHLMVSPWIVNNANYMKYIQNSYATIGNDGRRVGIAVNDTTTNGKNLSAPYNVLNAVYEFSDKYPVTVKLAVTYNTSGTSLPDPNITVTGINEYSPTGMDIKVNNPVQDQLYIYFPLKVTGEKATEKWYDMYGRLLNTEEYTVNSSQITKTLSLPSGVYLLQLQINGYTTLLKIIKE